MKKIQKKKVKCVDPGAKPNWHSPHKGLGSSWKGDKLMTSNYISRKRKRKDEDSVIKWEYSENGIVTVGRNGARTEYRGFNPIPMFVASRNLERLGIAPRRMPKNVAEFYKRNGYSIPKNYMED